MPVFTTLPGRVGQEDSFRGYLEGEKRKLLVSGGRVSSAFDFVSGGIIKEQFAR